MANAPYKPKHDQRNIFGKAFDHALLYAFRLVYTPDDATVSGIENLDYLKPQKGKTPEVGTLIGSNHVSMGDAVLQITKLPSWLMLRTAIVMDKSQFEAFTKPRPISSYRLNPPKKIAEPKGFLSKNIIRPVTTLSLVPVRLAASVLMAIPPIYNIVNRARLLKLHITTQIIMPKIQKLFFDRMDILTVDADDPKAVKVVEDCLKSGNNALIFMEGRLTSTGKPMNVFPGGPKILIETAEDEQPQVRLFDHLNELQARIRAPFLNLHLSGVEYWKGQAIKMENKVRQTEYPRLGITIAKPREVPMPPQGTALETRTWLANWIRDRMVEDRVAAANTSRSMIEALWDTMEIHGADHRIIGDPGIIRPKGYTIDVKLLGQKLAERVRPGETIGILASKASFQVAVGDAVEQAFSPARAAAELETVSHAVGEAKGQAITLGDGLKIEDLLKEVAAQNVTKVILPSYILAFSDWENKHKALTAAGVEVMFLEEKRNPDVDGRQPDQETLDGKSKLEVLYDVGEDFPIHAPDRDDLTIRELLARIYMLAPTLGKAVKPIETLAQLAAAETTSIPEGLPENAIPIETYLGNNNPPVGVLVPNSKAAVVTLFALLEQGRVPAMLNPKAGISAVISSAQTARLQHVITSRRAVELGRMHLEILALQKAGIEIIYLEDLRAKVPLGDAQRALEITEKVDSRGRPIKPQLPKIGENSPGVLLFTSGTEGKPKGVLLGQKGILTAVEQLDSVMEFLPLVDRSVGVAPLFHSFGYLIIHVQLFKGIYNFFIGNPLEPKKVVAAAYFADATAFGAPPSLLKGYFKADRSGFLRRVTTVFSGGEAKPKSLDDLVHSRSEQAAIREGYALTETVAALSANTPTHTRTGSVGRPYPLTEIKIVPRDGTNDAQVTEMAHPEIPGKMLKVQKGMLFVKGPQMMEGYIRAEFSGYVIPPKDGWHDTGDVVMVDQDGYNYIAGRNKHFGKPKGEMVSWSAVSEAITNRNPEHTSVVISIPDPEEGDRMVLFTTDARFADGAPKDQTVAARREVSQSVTAAGLKEVAIPKDIHFVSKEAFPMSGAQKPNYTELHTRAMAARAARLSQAKK